MFVEVNEVAKSSLGELFEISFAFLLYAREGIDESPDVPFGELCLSGILLLMRMRKLWYTSQTPQSNIFQRSARELRRENLPRTLKKKKNCQ
jgi:hypothetical protein